MRLPLDKRVRAKIEELAHEDANVKSIASEVKKLSSALITEYGLEGKVDPSDPRFYPNEQTISYWRRQSFLGQRLAKYDHTSVTMFVEEQQRQKPDDKWHLQLENPAIGQDFLLVIQV
eukprot:581755-Pelagomonas_calceolata.AAC.1